MANTFAPFGFMPIRRLDGASPTFNQSNWNILYSNNHQIFQGDPVTLLSSGYLDTLAPGSISSTVMPMGIFNGVNYVSASQNKLTFSQFYPGSSDQITNGTINAQIIDDPSIVYVAQTGYSSTGSGAATQAMVGMNCTYAYGTGTTLSGQSGAYVDLTTTPATTATLPFRIIGLVADPPGGTGGFPAPGANGTDTTTQYNWVYVIWNNEFFKQLTGV